MYTVNHFLAMCLQNRLQLGQKKALSSTKSHLFTGSSQQELSSLPSCHHGNSFRCNVNIKNPPPRAQQGSSYQYNYSYYSFGVVTIPVAYITQTTYVCS